MSRYGRKRFTLIEILILIVVIAILALIVIPRLLGAPRKAREAVLRGDLYSLRNAIQQFEADCGDYPAELGDIQVRPEDNTKGGRGKAIDPKTWNGPYYAVVLHGMLPADPFTHHSDWDYDPTTGEVHSRSTRTALNGEKYSEW